MESSPKPEATQPSPTETELYLFARAVNFATRVGLTDWPEDFSKSHEPERSDAKLFQQIVDGAN